MNAPERRTPPAGDRIARFLARHYAPALRTPTLDSNKFTDNTLGFGK